jgi:hypothetical protein
MIDGRMVKNWSCQLAFGPRSSIIAPIGWSVLSAISPLHCELAQLQPGSFSLIAAVFESSFLFSFPLSITACNRSNPTNTTLLYSI